MSKRVKWWMLQLIVLMASAAIFFPLFPGWDWEGTLAGCSGIAIVHLIITPLAKKIDVKGIDKHLNDSTFTDCKYQVSFWGNQICSQSIAAVNIFNKI